MSPIALKVVQVVLWIINWCLNKPKQAKTPQQLDHDFKKQEDIERLKDDIALADAIKSGDSDTVHKIREKRKHYVNIGLVLAFLYFFSSGCVTKNSTYHDIPLTSGDSPYRLPPGVYLDDKGVPHNEKDYRWSLSETDLYRDSQKLGK